MKTFFCILLFFFCFSISYPQNNKSNNFKTEAVKQMQFNRLGEAIDLLNKYISANPQNADGYNLRGQCYERRGQYENALYDYRNARKLAPNNKEINNNLQRTTENFQKLLLKKIEGHKREIAINDKKGVNYLEIGKSHKNMGEWVEAEVWYDKYLVLEEASPDEIIRYSEILAKNNHISKGEPILKKYTEKYPTDHRIWSKYGYFTMWLGKTKIAIKAFETSLSFKPFFKEAMDGLELAKGKSTIYTFNDTTDNYQKRLASQNKRTVKQKAFVYAIDKYYKDLLKNPKDIETRFKLVDELIKVERIEEAYQQLDTLSNEFSEDERYIKFYGIVSTVRDSINQVKVAAARTKLEKNPNDKEAIINLSEYYAGIENYDSAIVILKEYLQDKDIQENQDIYFRYAKYYAWNYDFENAIEQMNSLLQLQPDNLEFQLLRAQIAVWTSQDAELAENYLTNVLRKDPENLYALCGLASIRIREYKFPEAKDFIEKAKSYHPNSKEVEATEIYYESIFTNFESLKIYQFLFDAREFVVAGEYTSAKNKYEEYFSKITAPTKMEIMEYAELLNVLKEHQTALNIYDSLLTVEPDVDVSVWRAKTLLWLGDSTTALKELQQLVKDNPDHYQANMNLGVAYEYNLMFDEAIEVFQKLLDVESDSNNIAYLNKKIGWLSDANAGSGISNFPTNIGLTPYAFGYQDNQKFSVNQIGMRAEFGIVRFLTLGASVTRTTLKNKLDTEYLTSFKGHAFLRFSDNFTINSGFGTSRQLNLKKRNVLDVSVKYEEKDVWQLTGFYENTDARLLLYSSNLIGKDLDANLFRILGNYKSKSGLRISGYASYITVSDDNSGNDLLFRIGKNFYADLGVGYEFVYQNYAKSSIFYYSPIAFESHSIWLDWEVLNSDELKVNALGKLGYVPSGDYITRELSAETAYRPLQNLTLAGKFSLGSTYRYNTSYNYVSGSLSLYWSFY